ncbi:MAG: metallopeptidase TldD-related protein [Oscillospiraceae bacterium]|nr:metallopeptidase TldD-related protein [Oscillospiraceae bacterium]
MLELLINTLKGFEGVEYLINESKMRRIENYNIKKQSEMLREVELTQLMLTLYVTFSATGEDGKNVKYRGAYNTEIHPGTSPDRLRTIIEQGVFAAGFVKNAWFPLVMPSAPEAAATAAGKSDGIDEMSVLAALQEAFYSADCHERGHICYSEFFLTRSDVRIINSSGVDVSYTTYNAYVETAVHWQSEQGGEIEIYETYNFSIPKDVGATCEMLKERISHLFTVAEKKSAATPTPSVGEDIDILLSGDCLVEFFDYFHMRTSAAMIYQQLSTYKENEQIQGGTDKPGDKIAMTLKPLMEGSTHSRLYDDDGMPVSDHRIIENGKLLKYWGNTRFSSYLDIAPTGSINNFHITGGTVSSAELRAKPHLELVSFSAFQANPVTGDFGSEIRLGFYFDGKKTIPVTGGSITGNISQIQDAMRMSVEERQYNRYLGPATISIRGASISGVAGSAD